jgi:hypothetical protein
MPLDDIISGADFAEMIIGGWRYTFSSNYRLKKQRDWRDMGLLWMVLEITFGTLGFLFSLTLLFYVASASWDYFMK